MEVSGQLHAPTPLPQRKQPRYPLNKGLGEPQIRSGGAYKGTTSAPIAQSIYWLSYITTLILKKLYWEIYVIQSCNIAVQNYDMNACFQSAWKSLLNFSEDAYVHCPEGYFSHIPSSSQGLQRWLIQFVAMPSRRDDKKHQGPLWYWRLGNQSAFHM
jgi:hypothetical protein